MREEQQNRNASDENNDLRAVAGLALGDVLQLFSFVAACGYGAGWLFSAFMLERFGLQPADIGINAEFLLVRAGLIVGASALTLSVGYVVLRPTVVRYGRRGNTILLRPVIYVILVSYFVVIGGLLSAIVRYSWGSGPIWALVLIVVVPSLALTVVEGLLLLEAFGVRSYSQTGPPVRRQGKPFAAAGAVFLAIVFILPGAALAGLIVGRDVYRGSPISNPFISIRPVTAYISSSISPPTGAAITKLPNGGFYICGLELGTDGQSLRIWEPAPRKLVTVPVGYAAVVDGYVNCP